MDGDIPNVSSSMARIMASVQATKAQESTQKIAQEAADQTLQETLSPTASMRPGRQRDIKSRSDKMSKAKMIKEKGINLPLEKIKEVAEEFQKRNPELKSRSLMDLRALLKKGLKPDEILKLVRDYFEDVTLADEALEFLLQTADEELSPELLEAKHILEEAFGREIIAGKNIQQAVLEASQEGLGTPSSLRDLYRDITGTPRETTTLFEELANRYSYKKLKEVINYLLHSVGSDLKAKGSSIPRGLLHNLLKEVRALQAILGLYNFFKGRMPLLKGLFEKEHLPVPPELTFEAIAKQFMGLVDDRYPSPDKLLQSAVKLGIDQSIIAKIITFSQERDAVREVAIGQIYRSVDHRDGVLKAIISALEVLEDQLDDLLQQQEEDDF